MRCFRSEWLIGAVCLACAAMAPAFAAEGGQPADLSSDDLVALVQAGIRARQQSIDELIVYML